MITLFTQIQEAWDCNEWRKANTKTEGENYVLFSTPIPLKKTERKNPPPKPWFWSHALSSQPVLLCVCASYSHQFPLVLVTRAISKVIPVLPQKLLGSFPQSKRSCITYLSGLSLVKWGLPWNSRATKPHPMRKAGSHRVCFSACPFICWYVLVFM